MGKRAVIFPGVGYTKDRPLLYYSGKQAVKCGYELIHIDFGKIEWSKEKLRDRDFLEKTLEYCLEITQKALKDVIDKQNDEIIFISKSIGTVVATAYAKRHGINAGQICFSPLEMIEPYVNEGGAVLYYGDADPYADPKEIERISEEKHLATFCVYGGNHSLETGDVSKDIDNLSKIISNFTKIIG